MTITVIWEDKRGGNIKGFGPHDLLVSCVADDWLALRKADNFYSGRALVKPCVVSVPMKGNGNVINALRQDVSKLRRSGPVCAVLDRDEAQKLLTSAGLRPPQCLSGIRTAVPDKAPGDYELVLLIENMETLIEACCQATRMDMPRSKPSPDLRDRILGKLAWGDAPARTAVRNAVPSFHRLVKWVTTRLPSAITHRSEPRPGA